MKKVKPRRFNPIQERIKNVAPQRVIASLVGCTHTEISRYANNGTVSAAKRALIESTLDRLEHLLNVSPIRPDMSDVESVKQALSMFENSPF